MTGDYLTTRGRLPDEDRQMLADLGLDWCEEMRSWQGRSRAQRASAPKGFCVGPDLPVNAHYEGQSSERLWLGQSQFCFLFSSNLWNLNLLLPQLPPIQGVFVTGTDTDVGKTWVAAGLTAALRRRGVKAVYFKPVQSGCPEEGGRLIPTDADFARDLAGSDRAPGSAHPHHPAAAPGPGGGRGPGRGGGGPGADCRQSPGPGGGAMISSWWKAPAGCMSP